MTIKNYLRISLRALLRHKSRSALTILGVVIGIASIMLIVSLGEGAQGVILGQLSGLGTETIVIRPGKEPKGPTDVAQSLFADSIKTRDVEALSRKENVPYLVDIAPALIIPGSVSYEGETYRPMIFGWSAEFMAHAFDIQPEQGYLFDESDIKEKAAVAVIGAKVREQLFGGENPIGKYIKIKERKFRIVGLLPTRGQLSLFNVDDIVLIPYTSAQAYILGIDHYHEVMVRAESSDLVDQTVFDIKQTLMALHNIEREEDADFFVVTQAAAVEQISTIISSVTLFLSMVVAIALVVGGIGVMNIMLVSVTERTREIGLRKAVGATDTNILVQFLLEAVALTLSGGIIGIILGSLFSFAASVVLTKVAQLQWDFSFPFSASLLGLGVSAFVGVLFGTYPAIQASKKSPIEALRYE
jgi:putative ABC transport system permease protein